MNIVLGATGQIGSMLASQLRQKGQAVRAVVRNETKVQELKQKGIEVTIADYRNREALKKALDGGSTVFLLTPEDPSAEHYLDEVKTMIDSYREAVRAAGVRKVVGLSSMGAQNDPGVGNLYASYLLESAFSGETVEQVFVRPAYYYSNWLGYLDLVKEQGVLPTFFPPDLTLEMIAPPDVAEFLAAVMVRDEPRGRIYEIAGPRAYSSREIAGVFETVLARPVTVQQVMPEEWENTLRMVGFTQDAAANLARMTQAVIDGKTRGELPQLIRCSTNFKGYAEGVIKSPMA